MTAEIPSSKRPGRGPSMDPRRAIAKHIGWQRPVDKYPTTWSTPEPDNYNEGLATTRPLECPFIRDQVFYWDADAKLWWSVYFVPKEQMTEYLFWALKQTYQLRWHHTRPIAVRPRQGALHYKKNVVELTDNERLAQMGYFAKFSIKYEVDDTMLSTHLGPARADLYSDFSEV